MDVESGIVLHFGQTSCDDVAEIATPKAPPGSGVFYL